MLLQSSTSCVILGAVNPLGAGGSAFPQHSFTRFLLSHMDSAAERVPCEPGSSAPRCVALQMYSVVDPEVMGEAVQRFMARLGVAAEDAASEALQTMKIEQELTLIAEPETLLPYYVEMVKYGEVEATDTPTEKGGVTRQEDRRVYRYTYTR